MIIMGTEGTPSVYHQKTRHHRPPYIFTPSRRLKDLIEQRTEGHVMNPWVSTNISPSQFKIMAHGEKNALKNQVLSGQWRLSGAPNRCPGTYMPNLNGIINARTGAYFLRGPLYIPVYSRLHGA